MDIMEYELEKLILEVYKELEEINEPLRITKNLSINDLRGALERVLGFIDYCKFEFGEDVTER